MSLFTIIFTAIVGMFAFFIYLTGQGSGNRNKSPEEIWGPNFKKPKGPFPPPPPKRK